MFGWLPIIGPVIDGIVSVVKGFQDTKVKLDTNDLEEVKARMALLAALKDDIGIRLARDIVMFPVALWTALISWDTIVALRFPSLVYHVAPYPPSLSYLPYAVLAFLFGLQMRRMFR